MIRAILVAASLLALGACTGHKDAETAANADPVTPVPVKQKTVFDDQLKALDKAHAVQKTVDEQAKDADQAVKDAGG